MTSTDTTQNTVNTEPETVTVEVFIEETVTYTGSMQIDPADFLKTTGVELTRATGTQIRDYAIDAEIDHEESNENVAGQRWNDPTVHGGTDDRIAFVADGTVSEATEAKVLIDPAVYQETTGRNLDAASSADIIEFVEEYPEHCDISAYGGQNLSFRPVSIGRDG